jgi:hypothetical protein
MTAAERALAALAVRGLFGYPPPPHLPAWLRDRACCAQWDPEHGCPAHDDPAATS